MIRNKGTVSILGVKYRIREGNAKDFPELYHAAGYTDTSIKAIVLSDLEEAKDRIDAQGDLEAYMRRVLRHEITHAFLFESGLDNCSYSEGPWPLEEQIVDWIAIQAPKIYKAFKEAGCDE